MLISHKVLKESQSSRRRISSWHGWWLRLRRHLIFFDLLTFVLDRWKHPWLPFPRISPLTIFLLIGAQTNKVGHDFNIIISCSCFRHRRMPEPLQFPQRNVSEYRSTLQCRYSFRERCPEPPARAGRLSWAEIKLRDFQPQKL